MLSMRSAGAPVVAVLVPSAPSTLVCNASAARRALCSADSTTPLPASSVVSRDIAFSSGVRGVSGAARKRAFSSDCEMLVIGCRRMSLMNSFQVSRYSIRYSRRTSSVSFCEAVNICVPLASVAGMPSTQPCSSDNCCVAALTTDWKPSW